jgi:hypothetical protein
MGNTHGNEPWVKKPWVYRTFLVVIIIIINIQLIFVFVINYQLVLQVTLYSFVYRKHVIELIMR